MPELVLHYSNNIVEKEAFRDLFSKLHETLAKNISATIPGCLSRAIKLDNYFLGDGDINNAMLHLQVSVKEGRSREMLDRVAQEMMDILKKHFFSSLKERNLKITLELREMKIYLY